MSENENKTHIKYQSSNCRRICCLPCRAVLKCFHCLANVLVVRQAEGVVISTFNNKIAPFLAGVLVTTPIGVFAYEYGTHVYSFATTTGSMLLSNVAAIPEYIGPAVEQLSYAWNVTLTAASDTTNTVSQGIQSGYNILAPYINMTIDTGSSISIQIQQGYQGFLPVMNATMSNLRKKDENS